MDADPFDLVGDVLDGQFRVDAFAGEGDLSAVYRGHHIGVDATVAIKCLNLPATLDAALVRPLVETFREASRLHYRLARGNIHIAQSIAAGQTIAPRTGATVPYLVREWFEGESLASELARRRSEGKKGRTVDETLALLEPALDGMAYAHRHDVVHLSFSPSNLFVAQRDGARTLKVLDFGVARAMNELEKDLPHDSRPPEGLRVLFPSYAAPEQLDKAVGEVGAWTDVYAIALVVMEVLSDRIVMQGSETGALVDRALHESKRPTPQAHGLRLSRNLELVLARAVSLAPSKRQKDAGAFWTDVKNAARGTASRSMSAARPRSPTLVGIAPPGESVAEPAPAPATATTTTTTTAPVPASTSAPASTTATAPVSDAAAAAAPPPAPAPVITERLPPPLSASLPLPLPPVPRFPPAPETAPAFVTPSPRLPLGPPQLEEPLPVIPGLGLSRRFIAVTATVTSLMLVCLIVLIVTWPHPHRAPVSTAASPSVQPPSASPLPAATSAQAPAPVASDEGPAPAAPAPNRAPEATPVSLHERRFSALAAQHALGVTTRKLGRCKLGTNWGFARATVTFTNDGSVEHVVIGPPFTGTPTGDCVAEAMRAAHVAPFGGGPGVTVAEFFVPPR